MTQWEDGIIESPSDRLQRLLDEEDQRDLAALQWENALWFLGATIILLIVIAVFG